MKNSKRGDGQSKEAADSDSSSSFGCKLTRVAVSQTCQSAGFERAQTLALDVLSNIAALYLQSIAKSAACSANRHSRTQPNLHDVIFAMQEYLSSPASDAIKDLIEFVKYTDEIPFAQPLPFPTSHISKFISNNNNGGRRKVYGGRFSHVPRWLPPVPAVEDQLVNENNNSKEPKWGCLDVHHITGGGNNSVITGTTTTPLLLGGKRDRVSFSICMGGNNDNNNNNNNNNNNGGNVKGGGMCRGGAIGKRVLCTSCCWSEDAQLLTTKKPR